MCVCVCVCVCVAFSRELESCTKKSCVRAPASCVNRKCRRQRLCEIKTENKNPVIQETSPVHFLLIEVIPSRRAFLHLCDARNVIAASLTFDFCQLTCQCGRSQWPRGLRCGSATAPLLRLWVRIPPGAWRSVSCEYCAF